jgi:hypothetical protein
MAMRLFSRLALEQNSLAIKPTNMTARSIARKISDKPNLNKLDEYPEIET